MHWKSSNHATNHPMFSQHDFAALFLLEDVCICNNGVFEVPTSRSTTSSGNNHTTTISSKLVCHHNRTDLFIQHLLEITGQARGKKTHGNVVEEPEIDCKVLMSIH